MANWTDDDNSLTDSVLFIFIISEFRSECVAYRIVSPAETGLGTPSIGGASEWQVSPSISLSLIKQRRLRRRCDVTYRAIKTLIGPSFACSTSSRHGTRFNHGPTDMTGCVVTCHNLPFLFMFPALSAKQFRESRTERDWTLWPEGRKSCEMF